MVHSLIKKSMFSKNIFDLIEGISSLGFKTNKYPKKSSINISSQMNDAGNLVMWADNESEIINSKEICEILNKHLEDAKKEIFDIIENKGETIINK